jgi:hypothetical protein
MLRLHKRKKKTLCDASQRQKRKMAGQKVQGTVQRAGHQPLL